MECWHIFLLQNSLSLREESEVSLTELQHISIVLGFVEHVVSTSEPLQVKFALKLDPSIISNILKTILSLDSHHTAGGQDLLSGDKLTTNLILDSGCDAVSVRLVCFITFLSLMVCCSMYCKLSMPYQRAWEASLSYDKFERHWLSHCFKNKALVFMVNITSYRHGAPAYQEASAAFRYELKSSQKTTLSKIIISIVAVTRYLGLIKPEHMAEYKKVLVFWGYFSRRVNRQIEYDIFSCLIQHSHSKSCTYCPESSFLPSWVLII